MGVENQDTQQISFAQKYFEDNHYVFTRSLGWIKPVTVIHNYAPGKFSKLQIFQLPPEEMQKYQYDKPIKHK